MVEKSLENIRQHSRNGIKKSQLYIDKSSWYSKANLPYLYVFAAWLVYLIILVSTPIVTTNAIKVSLDTLYFVRFSIAIVYLVIWQAAIYSFLNLSRYSNSIRKSREAKSYSLIATGILVLLFSLMSSTFVSSINSYLRSNGHDLHILAILTNWLYIFPYVLAFGFFWQASQLLALRVKGSIPLIKIIIYGLVFTVFLYFWLNYIFTNPTRTTSPFGKLLPPTYYLKDSLIVLTIVLPAVVGWTLGLGTILNLQKYTANVAGIIYGKAFSLLTIGLSSVIVGSALLQAFQSLGNTRLIRLGLTKLLIIIYIFILIQIIGYIYFARGAKKLSDIENV